MHRGMREEEHGRHVKGQHATYAGNMTWSANPQVAYDFGSESNWPTKEGYKPNIHRVSAWVPESKIHHVPMMLGQLGGDLKRLGGGQLQRRGEHEIITAPGQYEVHAVSPIEPQEPQGLDDYKPRPFGKSEYFRSLKKGLKGDWKKEGYKITVRPIEPNQVGLKNVFVDAHDKKGNHVGHVGFSQNWANANAVAPGRDMTAGLVTVQPQHRRKGLATAMYDAAQRASKLKVKPDEPGHQSDLGRAFWAARKARLKRKKS